MDTFLKSHTSGPLSFVFNSFVFDFWGLWWCEFTLHCFFFSSFFFFLKHIWSLISQKCWFWKFKTTQWSPPGSSRSLRFISVLHKQAVLSAKIPFMKTVPGGSGLLYHQSYWSHVMCRSKGCNEWLKKKNGDFCHINTYVVYCVAFPPYFQ